MTYKTKSVIFAIAFAAMMLAWPMSTPTAEAVPSDASLDADCPVNFPSTVSLGSFAIGVDGTEVILASMSTGGTKAGNLRVDAQDWVGDGQQADGSVTFNGVLVGDTVTIDSIVYTGIIGASANNITFRADGGDDVAATELAASINAGDGATFDATATLNTVLIVTDADGNTSEPLATSNPVNVQLSGATVTGGEASGIVHMAAEDTRYLITTNGTAVDTGTPYLAKLQLNSDVAGDLVVAGSTDINQNVNMIMHVSGVGTLTNLPYSGALSQTLTVDVTCVA